MGIKILDFVMCFIEQGMCYLFFNALCEKRFQSRLAFVTAVTVGSIVLFLCSGINIAIRPFFLHLNVIVITSILYKDNLWIKSAYSIMILYIYSVIELLSNMMDNAIEAADGTDSPFVELNIFRYNAYLAICVKNSYIGNRVLVRTSNCLASTKIDNTSHGFGSRIIKDIALKYEGESTWEANGSCFNTIVLIKV